MITIENLLERLQSGSTLGVHHAVQEFVLGPIKGSQKAVPVLIDVFEKSEDGGLRRDCAVALGKIGGEQARAFLRSKMSTPDPEVMLGVASGLYSAGDKPLAVRMYYIMMESEAPEIRNAGRLFVSYHGRPVPEDMLLPGGGSVASLIKRSKMPGLKFENGAWLAKCDWSAASKQKLIDVFIANSQAEDGPDDEQYQVLTAMAKMKVGAWKKLRQAVERWVVEQDKEVSALKADDEDLKIEYLVVPKQFPALQGAFAVAYRSDWELEHGIELIVLPDGEMAIALNDRVAFQANWPTAIGRAAR